MDILARLRESAEKATTEPARAEIRTQLEALRDHPDVTQVARDRSAALLDRLRGRRGGRVRRRSTRTVRQRKWRVGCGVLLVLLMAAGIAVLVTRTGERAADSSLTHDQLTHLLLTQDDVDDVAGTTDMRVTAYSAKTDYSDDVFADHPECGVASTTASRRLYGDFDYTGVANQLLTSGNPDSLTVAQTLVAFATADEASTILENAARSWSACAGRTPSSSPDSADPMRFEDVVRGAASISQISEQPGVTLGTCQHVLAVVRAVVIETLGCASERTNIAERLADELARRVDRYADYLPPTREQNEPLFTVLLTPRELAAQQGTEQALDRFADEPRVNGSWMSVQKCDSATTHGTWRTYAGTRYVGFALQDTRGSSAGAQDRDVYQAVAAYANDVTATAVMDRTDEAWNDCADSEVQVVTPAGDRTRWRFDPVSRSGSTIVQLEHDVDAVANPWSCEHAMAVSGSDVYEAMVCDGDAAGEATSVVDRMVRNARS